MSLWVCDITYYAMLLCKGPSVEDEGGKVAVFMLNVQVKTSMDVRSEDRLVANTL